MKRAHLHFLSFFAALLIPCATAWGQARLRVDMAQVKHQITPYLYGAGAEDVNHEIYGGLYDQLIFGESFEEGPRGPLSFSYFQQFDAQWDATLDQVYVRNARTAKLLYQKADSVAAITDVQVKLRQDCAGGNASGLVLCAANVENGADAFDGYEVSLHGSGRYIVVGRHQQDYRLLAQLPVRYNARQWNTLHVMLDGNELHIFLNGQSVGQVSVKDNPLPPASFMLRTYEASASFTDVCYYPSLGKVNSVPFFLKGTGSQESGMWTLYHYGTTELGYGRSSNAKHGELCQHISNSDSVGVVGIHNMGLNRWGIAVQKGKKLQGSLWVHGQAENLKVALQSEDGLKEYARASVACSGEEWQRISFTLNPKKTDPRARFAIYLDGQGEAYLDHVILQHAQADQYHGLPYRRDISDLFTQQGLTFLRYGGTMVNAGEYLTKNMVGAPEERAPYTGHWYPFSTNGFAIPEFVRFAKEQGYVSSYAINIEDDPADVAAMIRWMKPLRSEYIEIGNEEVIFYGDNADDYDHYVDRFLLLREAILSEDPDAKLVCSAWWRPDSKNVERVFRALDGKCDFWDYHPWVDDIQSAMKVEGELRRMKELFHKWNPNTTMRCAIFEENGDSHAIRRMLCHAIVQNAVRRMGDFVLCTCPANALQPLGQNDNGWNQGQIFFTPSQAWGAPPYYGQQLSSKYHQPMLLYSQLIDLNPKIDCTATCSQDGRQLVLHLVNTSADYKTILLELEHGTAKGKSRLHTISGQLDGDNTPELPRRYSPTNHSVDVNDGIVLPPYSYNVLEVKTKRNDI